MSAKKYVVTGTIFLSFLLCVGAVTANAKPPREYDAIVHHLKTKYRAKKVNLFFMWAARAVVSIAKPAGVKSFSLTAFRGLTFTRETVHKEMQDAMRNSYGPEWSPIFHVRSRTGDQAYMYMKVAGDNVKVVLVTIAKEDAAIIRATFSPEKVADFINDPKIFGISLNSGETPRADPAKAN